MSPGLSLTCDCFNRDALLVAVEGFTRLSAVRWTVAGALEEPLRKRARLNGELRSLPDALCKLHDSVAQFAGSSKKLSLRLIV